MDIKVEEAGKITVVQISGDIDGKTAPVALERINPLVKTDCRLLLDMSRVAFMSSAGLRLLLSLQRQLTNKGKLVLVGLSEQIKDTMSVTGFLDIFTIKETVAEGQTALQ